MREERLPPQVTVQDPSRPGDVLAYGDEEPGTGRGRRSAGAAAVALLLLVAAVGLPALQERRADAARERRLGAQVALTLLPGRTTASSVDPGSRVVRLRADQPIRNAGPRGVQVLEATAGAFALGPDRVALPAGARGLLPLELAVPCDDLPARVTAPEALTLLVRTGSGERELRLPLPAGLDTDGALRACGLLPLDRSVEAFLSGEARVELPALVLPVDVLVSSPRPVRLLGLTGSPGLRVELRASDGSVLALPYALPTADGGGSVAVGVQLRLTVTDCAAATAATGAAAEAVVRLQVEDATSTAGVRLGYGAGLVRVLLGEVC